MDEKFLIQKAKEIITKIIYLNIATVNAHNEPWNSPVFTAFDEQYNFYWRSEVDSVHSENVKNSNKIFISIYDSTAPWGTGEGVFIQAMATELNDENEIKYALSLLDKRSSKKVCDETSFMNDSPRRIYRAVPQKVWVNVDREINGYFIDKRVEIKLK